MLSLASIASEKDSLTSIWSNKKEADSIRFLAFKDLIFNHYTYSDADSSILLADSMRKDAASLKLTRWEGEALNVLGISYYIAGNLEKAMESYEGALQKYVSINYNRGQASVLTNMANIFDDLGNAKKALELYAQALEKEEESNKLGLAYTTMNIGVIYFGQGMIEKAMDKYAESLSILKEIDHQQGVAVVLNNLAASYLELGQNDTAMSLFYESLKIEGETW